VTAKEVGVRSLVPINHKRNILCVFPAYTPSFGTFSHAYPLMHDVRAFMPPQGLLVIAGYLPQPWHVRFIDENIAAARQQDFDWADAVFVSGMHIQAAQIHDIHVRANSCGKLTVLGGSSVSSSPEMYPEFDYLHVGEIGDATDQLIAVLDECLHPPCRQRRFETQERLPLSHFPLPAYDAVPLGRYLIGSLQFSSGCPYRCDFCDIPALYGRVPRFKTSEQILAELDTLTSQADHPTVIYLVDDNFIGNRKATRELLPHLVNWQRRRGYPLQFACEATLNIAKQTEILELMREAGFHTIFVGIETPDLDALKNIDKGHNASLPMLESIETLNRYGLEVTAGIIMGLDLETDESEGRLIEFIDRSQVPILTINVLQALPKTPLWDRLQRENRLVDDPTLESNVRFLRPHDDVIASWRRVIAHAYSPDRLFARFRHQVDATYVNRLRPPPRGKLSRINLKRGLVLASNIIWRIGIRADFRWAFWRAAWQSLRRGQIEPVFGMGFVGYHLIRFTQEALGGRQNASFYATKKRNDDGGALLVGAEASPRLQISRDR
jgi:hopanoid C-2 methylase